MKLNPRIKIHKDGRCTISGLNYDDARSLFTAAYLYSTDDKQKENRAKRKKEAETIHGDHLDEIRLSNFRQEKEWWRRRFWMLKALEDSMNAAIAATHPKRSEPSLKEKLRERDKTRKVTRKVIDAIIAKMVEGTK